MRILMASRRFPPDAFSGTDTVFQALYEQARTKHEVRLGCRMARGRERIPTEAVGVKLSGLGLGKQWVAMAKAIRSEVKRWRPDVVLSNNIESPPDRNTDGVCVHDLDFGEPGGRPVGTRFEGWMSRAAHRVRGEKPRSRSRGRGQRDGPDGVDGRRRSPRSHHRGSKRRGHEPILTAHRPARG